MVRESTTSKHQFPSHKVHNMKVILRIGQKIYTVGPSSFMKIFATKCVWTQWPVLAKGNKLYMLQGELKSPGLIQGDFTFL